MLDQSGPWGTGPFILSKGYSSLTNIPALIKTTPFQATWLTVKEERTPYVLLEANQQYWNKKRGPKLKSVVFRNDLTLKEALHLCTTTEGQVDIVTKVSPKDSGIVKTSTIAKLMNVKGNEILTGVFNQFQQHLPFNDRRLRLAVNLAVDRMELIEQGFKSYAQQVPALTLPWAFDFPEELVAREHNPTRARQLLNEVGWPEGRKLKLAVKEKYEDICRLLASQLEKNLQVGVEVFIIPFDDEVKWDRVNAEKKIAPPWDVLIASTTALFLEDTPAYFHREFFGSDGKLRMGPVQPEFERLYQKMMMQTDRTKRLEVAKDIDRYVYKEALSLFLCSPEELYAVNRHVDFKPYKTTFELAETSVSDQHWSRK
ncbi:ABC transporter substrate-binding protein [Metabacillus herbersteinensis]|uniref:ABC transporter substrate-binding protein n=1 Tax=Metabacillus herbersteinensis TaxID=283816 RepID=A0ABV6GBH5_9BACI